MRASAKIFLTLLFLALALNCAETARAVESLPRVSMFEFRQTGGTDLTVEIWGSGLPQPRLSCSGNMTEIVLPGVSGEKARRYDYEGMTPLVTAARSAQIGEDFIITMMTAEPLEQREIRGVPPGDVYTLHLRTSAEVKRIAAGHTVAGVQNVLAPTGPFASDAPVTLDLRDVELRDVFRMFGEQLKKNIIIHDSMPDELVTMTFDNSPLSGVVGYLMRNYNLACEFIDDDTILVGGAAGLSRISGKEEVRAYRIAYADPAALAALLPSLTQIQAAGLVVDPRLRTLYATGTPDVQEEIAIAVQKLDSPGKQIMLHARILQFNKGDSPEISKALDAAYGHWKLTYGDTSGMALRYDETAPARNLDIVISALESRTHLKTLANPSVITIDGMEAKIDLTQEFPYISDRDEAGNATWSTIQVGPMLTITPVAGRDDTITLKLDLSTSTRGETMAGNMGEEMPTTAKRQVITNVRVRNGEPFVVGGLFMEDKTDNRYGIPILGQLPLLGEIFTYRDRDINTTQVVMVVIPYILDTPDSAVEYERVMIRQ